MDYQINLTDIINQYMTELLNSAVTSKSSKTEKPKSEKTKTETLAQKSITEMGVMCDEALQFSDDFEMMREQVEQNKIYQKQHEQRLQSHYEPELKSLDVQLENAKKLVASLEKKKVDIGIQYAKNLSDSLAFYENVEKKNTSVLQQCEAKRKTYVDTLANLVEQFNQKFSDMYCGEKIVMHNQNDLSKMLEMLRERLAYLYIACDYQPTTEPEQQPDTTDMTEFQSEDVHDDGEFDEHDQLIDDMSDDDENSQEIVVEHLAVPKPSVETNFNKDKDV